MTERTERTTKKSLLEEKWLYGRCKVSMREYTKPPSKRLRVGEYLITAAWREKTHLVSMSFSGPRGTLVQIEETVQWHEVRRQTSWQKLLVWHWKGVISQPVYRRYGHRIYPHSPRHYGISACLTICHTHSGDVCRIRDENFLLVWGFIPDSDVFRSALSWVGSAGWRRRGHLDLHTYSKSG